MITRAGGACAAAAALLAAAAPASFAQEPAAPPAAPPETAPPEAAAPDAAAPETPPGEAAPVPAAPAGPTLSQGADGMVRLENVTQDDALKLAMSWIEQGRNEYAEQLLAQIAPIWPKDARIPFLRGLAARGAGDERRAVKHFRDALELEPNANRARYELARSYEALHEWDLASFQLRFVLGSDAPAAVKADVASRLVQMSDRRKWTTSFEAAVAPSSNVNVAPSERTIDPIFGSDNPAVLTDGSTAQTGVGAYVSAGVARAFPLAKDTPSRRLRGQIGIAGATTDYDQRRFDDSSASVFTGFTLGTRSIYLGGDVRMLRRWYGGKIYEDVDSLRLWGERRVTGPVSLRLEATAADRNNKYRDDYDGGFYTLSTELRVSTSGSSFLSIEPQVTRFDTDAKSTSFWETGLYTSYYKDFRGGYSVQLAPGYAHREDDGPDPFFLKTRQDDRWSFAGSVIKRDFEVLGLAPFIRYRYTYNNSKLKLYDYEQHAGEVGFTGVF